MLNLDIHQKNRLKQVVKKGLIIFAVCFLYYVFMKITGTGIPCLIKAVTGKYCPGCGISRMFIALAGGDVKAALRYNLLVTVLLPFAAFFVLRRICIYIKDGAAGPDKIESVFYIIVFVLMVAFWIMRNTETFSFLAPAAV